MIVINKISFDFHVANEQFARNLNRQWDKFYNSCFESVVEKVMEKYDNENCMINLSVLELELCSFTEDNFYEKFPLRLNDCLKETLHNMRIDINNNTHAHILSEDEHLQSVIHSLMKGDNFNSVKRLKENEISTIAGMLMPKKSQMLSAYIKKLQKSSVGRTLESKVGSEFRFIKWEFIFEILLKEPSGNLNRMQFVADVIRKLSAHYALNYQQLVTYFKSASEFLPIWLQEILEDLEKNFLTINIPIKSKPELKLSGKEIIIKNKPIPKNRISMNNKTTANKTENSHSAIYEIENAGLVLFSPWIPQLFHKCGLLDNQTKEFVDHRSRVKAVFILQELLATTSDDKYNHTDNLQLNRLLADVAFEEVLPADIHISNDDRNTVDSLQAALIGNWDKMKNTSVEGFLETFVRRKGILEENEDLWLLTFEKHGVDMMLNSLPWAFSMIKYPWMKKMIKTEI
ncbi:MAG: hypothetical protein LBM07_02240 [Culturomica sp.]|jgi:hypothetical protein|nr:hypothetical protein [Culturomica sp.]